MITGKRLEIERLTGRLGEGRWKSTQLGNSLATYPTCAMVRTERMVPRGDRSSRQKTSRRPALPDSERIGNKSMAGKREMSEDVYGIVLQRLRDMVKAGLPESQCPVVEPHTRR